MSRKVKIIIALVVLLLAFLITMVVIVINKTNKDNTIVDDDFSDDQQWAVNTTDPNWNASEEETTEETETLIVAQVSYNDLEKLSSEQYANRDRYMTLVDNYATKPIKSVDIIDSNDEVLYIVANYKDETTEELVVLFDPYKTHGFMRCVSREYYEYIQSGENAG